MIGKKEVIVLGVAFVTGTATGLTFGWKLWRPAKKTIVEKQAPEVKQKDGSLIIQRDPNAKIEHKNEVPEGAVVEREVKVVVSPGQLPEGTTGTLGSLPVDEAGRAAATVLPNPSSKVTIFLTLVKMKDGTRRVIASSPNGTIDSASIDIPTQPIINVETKPLKWTAGAIYGQDSEGGTSKGVFLDRKVGWAVAGAEVARVSSKPMQGWDVRLKFGISF